MRPVFQAIDHIGVAVEDLDASIELYRDLLELPLEHRETVTEQGVEAALLGVGDSHVELLAPLGPDTPVGRFLTKRGPGIHHAAYRCQDVAAALELCKERGMRVIDERPRPGIRGSLVAFLHPGATDGVLTELVQPAAGH
jgi:methylmalonyl-CoA/ethylmalonyl-CoA epimerase